MPASPTEQYLLELVNEARLDPAASVRRYVSSYAPLQSSSATVQAALAQFGVDGARLQAAFAGLAPARPVVWSDTLATTARGHNVVMAAADAQSHTLPGEPGVGVRLTGAGYAWRTYGENVFAYAQDMLYAQAGFMVDWGGTAATGGMQDPAGHRITIMAPAVRELGVGVLAETDPATKVGPYLVTQDFGSRGETGALLGGVAFTDTDGDGFYTLGEGRAGLVVQAPGASTVSSDAGGWSLELPQAGLQTLTLSGAGLPGPVAVQVMLGDGANIKLDVVNGTALRTSASAAVSGPVTVVQGLGVQGLVLSSLDNVGRTYIGTAGADALTGGAGNDILIGGPGDVLDGGGGYDVARLTRMVLGQSGAIDVAGHTLVVPGTLVVTEVERAEFVDGAVVFDADAPVAAVTRLYDAAFGRAPEALGLHNWTEAVGAGTPLRFIADAFAGSAEYASRYPAATNSMFVEQLYQNTLLRPSDPGGKASWLAALDAGATRGDVLVAFSESAEHRANTAGTVNAGMWEADNTATQVARMYDTAFSRRPDAGGLMAWTGQIKSGAAGLEAVAGAFASSAEFQATYGSLDDRGFAAQLYRNTLKREADAGGLQFWSDALATGRTSRAGVVLGFSESAEHQALTAGAVLGSGGRMGVLLA